VVQPFRRIPISMGVLFMVQRFAIGVKSGFTVAVFGTFVLLMSLSFDSLLGIHKQRFVRL
jgi:hypothetical protein